MYSSSNGFQSHYQLVCANSPRQIRSILAVTSHKPMTKPNIFHTKLVKIIINTKYSPIYFNLLKAILIQFTHH